MLSGKMTEGGIFIVWRRFPSGHGHGRHIRSGAPQIADRGIQP